MEAPGQPSRWNTLRAPYKSSNGRPGQHDHVVRMVGATTNKIATIAGRHAAKPHQRIDPRETNPLNLNLPKLSALDYYDGRLFIREWDGDLIIMKRVW